MGEKKEYVRRILALAEQHIPMTCSTNTKTKTIQLKTNHSLYHQGSKIIIKVFQYKILSNPFANFGLLPIVLGLINGTI